MTHQSGAGFIPGSVSRMLSDQSALENLDIDVDNDSAIGGMSMISSTASLSESVYDFPTEHGRTYHRYKQGKYFLPNDKNEQDRLDLQHYIFLESFHQKLVLAPIQEDVHNVLDLATGTGLWAIDFATRYPSASVIGTDLSPIQPQVVPPNCRFELDDAEDTWTFNQKFDLIHGRALVSCFDKPYAVIAKAFDACAPGGYLEFQDFMTPIRGFDDSYKGSALETITLKTIEAGTKLGRDFTHPAKYKQYFEEAGFVDIVEKHFQWPVGSWAKGAHMKTIGLMWQQDILHGIDGMTMAVLTRAGMNPDEATKLIADAKRDILNPNMHVYMPVIVVYGRRPLDSRKSLEELPDAPETI